MPPDQPMQRLPEASALGQRGVNSRLRMDLPSEKSLRWIVRTYAHARASYGDAIGNPALIQPNGTFFPDEFRLDAPSVQRLLGRMIGYSPVSDDVGVELAFIEPDANHAGGCGSLACGPSGRGVGTSLPGLGDG